MVSSLRAQILNPNDPVPIYDSNNPPKLPSVNSIGKWVITSNIKNWPTDSYKPYIYNGANGPMAFRLLYPKSYNPGLSSGNLYPLVIFFHGFGEARPITENDRQLFHGGQNFLNARNNNHLDAFCLFPQSTGAWGPTYYDYMVTLVNYMVQNAHVDPQRIIVVGLSEGGVATWDMLSKYPTFQAAGIPIGASNFVYNASIPNYKYTPIWLSQGGKDKNPLPSTSNSLVANIQNAGGNITYSFYPDNGHNTWDTMFVNKNFFPWINSQNKANPWPLHGQTNFCSSQSIQDTLGLSPGFSNYQWKFNGIIIPGANKNTYVATQAGTYSAQYYNGTSWSTWSPNPVVITLNVPTQTPNIQLATNESLVFPSLDNSKGVQLTVPGNFTSYSWIKKGSTTVLGTGPIFLATQAGDYQCSVKTQFACSTIPSPYFTVIAANGQGAPGPISNLKTSPVSSTSLNLTWTYNSGTYPATGFEIYRSSSKTGPYTFLALLAPSLNQYLDKNLSYGQTYYYEMRAVNGNGASSTIGPVMGATYSDNIPPSVPSGLVLYPGSSSANLVWNPSTDNVGVVGYYVFINGVKTYRVSKPSISIYNLNEGQNYSFTVEAFDMASNVSASSTTVSAAMYDGGFNYKYFALPTNWTSMQDLNSLNPYYYGNSPSLDLSKASRQNNYAFLWNGTLHIPVSGNYTFLLNSTDGSQVFIDEPYDFTIAPTINNDGVHGPQTSQITLTLTKGEHKIAVAYFHNTSVPSLSLSWMNTANGIGSTAQIIPNSIFALQNPDNSTSLPTAPNTLTGIDNNNGVNLSWKDLGTNNSGYNIYRSFSGANAFHLVNSTPVQTLNYLDISALGDASYQYYVNAVNPFGTSANTNTLSIKTSAKIPSINPIVNPTWQVGTLDTLFLNASPRSGNSVSLSVTGLSASAKFIDKGNGLGLLIMNPINTDIGVHNLVFKAVDSYSGVNSLSFTITIKALVNPLIPLPPTSLTAQGTSLNSINLNWVGSAGASEYFIYQSSTASGPWKLIASLAAGINTYSNTGLNINTGYFYQIKAKNSSGLSDPGNTAFGSTLEFLTQLQFNTDQPAGFPWNSVNASPFAGLTLYNLGTTSGNNSGINITMTNGFSGTNIKGDVTGNNSGIYPDAVLRGQFYVQTPDSAILTVSGLAINRAYDFIFLNSWYQPFGPGITTYTINGTTVSLDPTNNINKTVQINNILADHNGLVKIIIKAGIGQTFGIINSLVIQSHQVSPSQKNNLLAIGKGFESAVTLKNPVLSPNLGLKAYPVPFSDELVLSFHSEFQGHYKIRILNIQGQLVYDEPIQTLQIGTNSENLSGVVSNLPKGPYIIQFQSDVLGEKALLVTRN